LKVYGVDFTCAPRRAKPITVAAGIFRKNALQLEKIELLQTFGEFEAFLARPGPWIGGFDFPFGMPAELVDDLGWPKLWTELISYCSSMTRLELRSALDAYRGSRPVGRKYAHRATDRPAGSSSPMKLVNPPVALMFHEGARRIAASRVHVPALCAGDPTRIALEAYPGLLVRGQLGIRESYKSDTRSEQTAKRLATRKKIVSALKAGQPLGIRLEMAGKVETLLAADGSGDSLDAAICAVQAHWAWSRRKANFGLPAGIHPAEGWIVSAEATEAISSP
jgi:hypothetical protein